MNTFIVGSRYPSMAVFPAPFFKNEDPEPEHCEWLGHVLITRKDSGPFDPHTGWQQGHWNGDVRMRLIYQDHSFEPKN